jgi:galactose mutarotase-like enzyme
MKHETVRRAQKTHPGEKKRYLMEYTVKSNALTVKTRSFGGELTSIRDGSGTEYLWQGDPKYWKGQAPVLFPIVGSLRDKKAVVGDGKTCCMERHGVVRRKEFRMTDLRENAVTFSISSDEETRARYPFDFQLETTYSVVGNNITVSHTVTNPNKAVLPFQIGGHPAFNCPIGEGGSFEDYDVEFEQPETAECPLLDENGLPQMDRRVPVLQNSNILPLKHELFFHDALIFDRIRSRRVTLRSRKTGRGVSISFPELNYLLIWSSANSGPFVALEPWSGLGTCSDENNVFEKKRGVFLLPAGEEKKISYTISIVG